MRKIVVRLFLFCYPLVALGLYLGVIYRQNVKIATLQEQVERLKNTTMARKRKLQAQEIGKKQWDQVRTIISAFAEKSRDFDRLSLPVFVGHLARDTNVELVELLLRTDFEQSGFGFVSTEAKIHGSFSQLLSFLRRIEEGKGHFVFVDQLRIEPMKESARHELSGRFNVLLRGPGPEVLLEM